MRYELQQDVNKDCYAIIGSYKTLEELKEAYSKIENKKEWDKFFIVDNTTGYVEEIH